MIVTIAETAPAMLRKMSQYIPLISKSGSDETKTSEKEEYHKYPFFVLRIFNVTNKTLFRPLIVPPL